MKPISATCNNDGKGSARIILLFTECCLCRPSWGTGADVLINLSFLIVKLSDGVPEETGMDEVFSDLQALKRLYGLLQRVRTSNKQISLSK